MRTRKQVFKVIIILLLTLLLLFVLAYVISQHTAYAPEYEAPDYETAAETDPSPSVPVYVPTPSAIEPTASPEEPSEEPIPEIPQITAFPVWMYIPALNVDAEIQDTGTDYVADSMEIVPSGSIISWWRESAIPGNAGNAIFGSHNRWKGENGQLFELDTLEVGDGMVIVYADGSSLNFQLESVFVYLLATAPSETIMALDGEARVTLITCKAPFNTSTGTNDNRIIAIFKEESVFEVPDPPITPFPPKEVTEEVTE